MTRTAWKFEDVLAFWEARGLLPSPITRCPVEKKLADGLNKRCAPGHRLFSPDIRAWRDLHRETNMQRRLARRNLRRAQSVRCVNDGKLYSSFEAAAKAYGLRNGSVRQCARFGHRTRGGLRFETIYSN